MKWIEYRNYLMSIACNMEICTIEYKNILRRIDFAHNKAYQTERR